MEILAIALTLLWLSAPEQLRYGCYALTAFVVIVVLAAAFFGWPVATGLAVVGLIQAIRDERNRPPSLLKRRHDRWSR